MRRSSTQTTVSSKVLNCTSEISLSRNATGREFQRHGPVTEKLLSLRRIRVDIIIIIIIKAIYSAQDPPPPRRPQMRCLAVRKCSCLYTMYHINNNVFSCVLKVVRLQSDIRNAVGKLFHTE